MNAGELEAELLPSAVVKGSLILFEAAVASRLIRKCFEAGLPFLGIEAFRLSDDGGAQPALEFSNISFGRVEERNNQLRLVSFERSLRQGWAQRASLRDDILRLIDEGTNEGYCWFEVSIADPDTEELLFFRAVDAQQ